PVPSPCPATTPRAPPASTTSPCSASSTASRTRRESITARSSTPRPAAAAAGRSRRTPMDDFRQMINYDELTSDDSIALARTAAEVIRGLNWTTNCDAGLDQPSAAYDVIGALSQAAGRLGQLFTQITRYLD